MSSLDVPALSDETNLLLKPRPCSTPKQNLVFRRVVLALAVLAAVSLALGGGYRRFRAQTTEAAQYPAVQLQEIPLLVQPRLVAGPGCPTGCGSFTACSLTGINRLVYRKDDEPRTRLYNKDRVDFQEQMELYDCPAVDGVECKIPTLFLNDDFCDCPGCEDEDSHTCEDCGFDLLNDPQASVLVTADQLLTCSEECDLNISFYCIGGGFLPPGAEVFTCPSGCQIQAFAQDDGICDCPEDCADEQDFTCKSCGCAATCSRSAAPCPSFCGKVFSCPTGFKCDIPIQWVNDNICDCEDCADEQLWTCENCGCPRSCSSFWASCEELVFTWTCPNHPDCKITSFGVNDYVCDCPDCADEVMFTCDTCASGCPSSCREFSDSNLDGCFGGDFRHNPVFTCDDGCEVPRIWTNDRVCDCSNCEDEDAITCETCTGDASTGCPRACGDFVRCEALFTCPDDPDGCVLPLAYQNDGFCDCPGTCADEPANFTCSTCFCAEECGEPDPGGVIGVNFTFPLRVRPNPGPFDGRRLGETNRSRWRSSLPSREVSRKRRSDKVRDRRSRPAPLRSMQSTGRTDDDGFDCGDGCTSLDRRYVNDRVCDCTNCADEVLFTCESCLPGTPAALAFPQAPQTQAAAVGASIGVAAGLALGLGLGLGLTGPLAALVVSRGTIVLSSPEDLTNNVAVQKGLKRALARLAGDVAESAITLLWACLAAGGTLVRPPLRQLASVVTLCFEIEVRDEADGLDVCTKLMKVSGPGVESVIAEELAKVDAQVTVRVVEWSPDPNPQTLSPTAQTLETKVPETNGPIQLPSSLGS